jgi:hypothetical protein
MSEIQPNNGNIGNAVHELAPNTTWKLLEPGTEIENLIWMDDLKLRPTNAAILAKTAELDKQTTPKL